MPMLRPRQEAFVRRYIAALDEPAAASYRLAGYRARKGNSSAACASRLLTQANIVARIQELQAIAAKRHEAKIDTVTHELQEAYAGAMATHQHSAAVAACMGLAKLHGLIVNKHESHKPSDVEACNSISDVVDEMIEQAGSAE